ncbi:zinc finger protein [Seiridium cupressi]
MGSKKYPSILPAPTAPEHSSSSLESPVSKRDLGPKRLPIAIACNACRRKKTKASSWCPFVDSVPVLSLPEGSAADLLATIRDNRNDAAVLSNFKASSHGTPYSTASEWESGLSQPPLSLDATLETELMAQYPCAYPALVPILASDLARSDLLGPISGFAQHGGDGEIDSSSDTPEAGSATPGSLSAPRPSQESDYYDERLRHFKTSFWTDILLQITLPFIDAVSNFRSYSVPLSFFQEQPLPGRSVSAARIRASTPPKLTKNTTLTPGVVVLDVWVKLTINIKGLADLGDSKCIVLLMTLRLSHLGRDKDHCVLYYAKEVRNMGIALNLFGADAAADTPFGDKAPDHNHIASCYAAWGGFNWTVLVSLFYRQPGSEKPAAPPKLPIPGEESLVGQDLDYPMKPVKEFLMGTTFPALCRFWRIVQRTEWIHYPDHDSPPENFKQELMEYNFREVIAWTHTLPRAMLAHQNSSHHVIVFHIWLHTTIMDILRPHIGKSDSQRHRMRTFAAATACPDDAYTASVNQLKRLVINYRSNHQASTFSILWQNGLLYLANATLRDTRDPEWRLYFLLCINGYEALRRPYPMSGVMIQSLLSMTLLYTDMMGTEARRIMDQLNRRDLKGLVTDCEDNIRATFMADLALASKDPEAARVENLAGELEHLVAFKDFVASDAMDI